MGTRGVWGFRVDGVDKLTYCHSDAYPEGLGEDLTEAIKALCWQFGKEKALALARALRVIGENSPSPTVEDVELLKPWTDLHVSEKSTSDWYCLTRHLQRRPLATLEVGIMLDGSWGVRGGGVSYGYIINLDDMAFEVYESDYRGQKPSGRYASQTPDEYGHFPPRLVTTFPLGGVPQNWADIAFPNEAAE